MKILHGPVDIGGMASTLARAQRKLGHGARSFVTSTSYLGYPIDIDLSARQRAVRWLAFQHFLLRMLLENQVFQFYFGGGIYGDDLKEIRWLRRLGKKVFFYFCGCDLRDADATVAKYDVSACAHCSPRLCRHNRVLARDIAAELANVNFVSTPDLLEFLPGSVLLPQVVDFDLIETIHHTPPVRRDPNRLVVAHAPTNRALKGTSYLLSAIGELQREGWPIEIVLIENLRHAEALQKYYQADLGVDQLLAGAYGLLSAELMALGIPTVCYLRPDLVDAYPELPPLLNAHPGTIKDQLKFCCENRDVLQRHAELGMTYARRHHHPMAIARKCLDYYLN